MAGTLSTSDLTLTEGTTGAGFYPTLTFDKTANASSNQGIGNVNCYYLNTSGNRYLAAQMRAYGAALSGTTYTGYWYINALASTSGQRNYLFSSTFEANDSAGSIYFRVANSGCTPGDEDNLNTLGNATYRWSVVYAGTGTINTSDVNEKEQIADLDAAELRVATAIKNGIKKFKWKDAVAKKGDAARIHVGVIAQEIEAAFVAEGLDPERYGLFCKDVWWERVESDPMHELYWEKFEPNPEWVEGGSEPAEILVRYETEVDGAERRETRKPTKLVVYEEEVEGGVRKERKGIRYDQLLAFVIAAL
jgi:hypothetical protein